MDMYDSTITQPNQIVIDQSILTQLQSENESLRKMVVELQMSIEQLKTQQVNQHVSSLHVNNENKNISDKPGCSSDALCSSSKKQLNEIEKNLLKLAPKIYKPPPITASGVKNINDLISNLIREEAIGHEQQLKTIANGDIKIMTGDEHQFRRTLKVLEKNKIEYHRYQLKTEKKFRVVIRGLHPDTEVCEIKRALADNGHYASDVTNIQIRKKINPNDKNSEKTIIKLPLFFVDLDPRDNNKDIYDLNSLCYHKIKLEPPKEKKGVPQCKNCQAFSHTQNYCHKKSICVKCGEEHKTEDCPKPKKSKSKCANCGEAHTANWKGCSAYKKAEEKIHPKKTSAVQRLQQKPAKTVTSDVSYAKIVSSSNENNVILKKQIIQPAESDNSALMKILSALKHITKSLTNMIS